MVINMQLTFDNIKSNISKEDLEKKQEKRDCERLIREMRAIGLSPSEKSLKLLEDNKNLCLTLRQMMINDVPDSQGCENPYYKWIIREDDEESVKYLEHIALFGYSTLFTTKKNYELAHEIFDKEICWEDLYSTIGENIFRKMKRQ